MKLLAEYFINHPERHTNQITGQVPEGWNVSVRTGDNHESEPTYEQRWLRPETRMMSDAFLPDHEHETHLNKYNFVYKLFGVDRAFDFEMTTSAFEVGRGDYMVTLDFLDDTHHNSPIEPDSFQVRASIGDTVSDWMNIGHGVDNTMSFALLGVDGGKLTINFRSKWAIVHSCVFIRSIQLDSIDIPDLPPPQTGNSLLTGLFLPEPLTEVQAQALDVLLDNFPEYTILNGIAVPVASQVDEPDEVPQDNDTTTLSGGGGGGLIS